MALTTKDPNCKIRRMNKVIAYFMSKTSLTIANKAITTAKKKIEHGDETMKKMNKCYIFLNFSQPLSVIHLNL